MKIAIDARAAGETAAGRGRYVRELLRQMPSVSGDREVVLYGTVPWQCPEIEADERFRWELLESHPLAWPFALSRRVDGGFDALLATSSYLLAAIARVPAVAVVWDFAPFDRRYGAPRGSYLERVTFPVAARRAARFAAISESTRDALLQRFPGAAERTDVVYPAASERFSRDGQADADARARHGLHRPYVLAVGTLEPRKNLPRLIEAFAALPEAVRGDHELVVAGASGWETNETFASVSRHADLVRTLGFVVDEDLPALYRGATVFAYPSLYEGFGLPVLEAMQCGVPVLTSSLSSMPEVGGQAAVYADPFDVEAIGRRLTELLTDEALRRRLAQRGPDRAADFSWARSAAAMIAVLEGVACR